MIRALAIALLALVLAVPVALAADVDITGTWTSTFSTQIGDQHYTYTFAVKGTVLTGTAKNDMGETPITDGKVEGTKVSFVEKLNFQGNDLVITYTGEITSNDEIKFTRQVGDFATEQLVATRAK
jgi:hypothetical protein